MMTKKIYLIQHDDELGPEWAKEDNIKSCLFTKTHIGKNVDVTVTDITDIMMAKEHRKY